MTANRDRLARTTGSPLTDHERALLERMCAGDWPGAAQARAQLAHARWGGKDHDGDACFLVDIPASVDVPAIPPHNGGPIATLGVVADGVSLGTLELWVNHGRLHSLDYSTFDDADVDLPKLHYLDDQDHV